MMRNQRQSAGFSVKILQTAISWVFSENSPNPFKHQCDVHKFGVHDTQTTLVLRVVFSLVTFSFLEESASVFIEAHMSAIRKKEESHGKNWETREASISEDQTCCREHEPTLPRLRMFSHHCH
jgi:hypothetical protein